MLTTLFSSNTRVQILSLLFQHADREFYTQEIIKLTETDPSNAHRELTKLRKIGLLADEMRGNQRYFRVDKKADFYETLQKLFDVHNRKAGRDKWMVMEEMPNYYPLMAGTGWNVGGARRTLKKYGMDCPVTKLVTRYSDNMCALMSLKHEFDRAARAVLAKFLDDPGMAEKFDRDIRKNSSLLCEATDQLEATNFGSLSNEELADLFERYFRTYEMHHDLHWIQTFADFGDNLFSDYLLGYLKKQKGDSGISVGEAFSTLTTPTEQSYSAKEYKSLLDILAHVTSKPELASHFKNTEVRHIAAGLGELDNEAESMIDRQAREYGWLGYNTVGPRWGKEYYIDLIRSLVAQGVDAVKLKQDFEAEAARTAKRHKELAKELAMDTKHQALFYLARTLVFTKALRKDEMFHSYAVIENLYREIGRRFYLSLRQVRYLYPHELSEVLRTGKYDAALLNRRYKYSVHHSTDHYSTDELLDGRKAREFMEGMDIIKIDVKNVKNLQGDCASAGRVRGTVKIVNVPADMKKVEEGNILISIATTPDLVPAIKKSAAIVTDVGGITCHAAIISRELGIPCVTGTKIATKVLRDGDIIDVDATHGKVVIIKRAEA